MRGMGKKKSSKSGTPKSETPKGDAHKGTQVPFRVDDLRLVEALDAYAESERRSRNMAIIILLEDALKAVGFWPWPRPSPPPTDTPAE